MFNNYWQKCQRFFSYSKYASNKKYQIGLFSIIFFLIGFSVSGLNSGETRVIYSLDNKKNDIELIKVIDQADKFIYFAIYYFSKENIADAMVRASKRGVKVIGVSDRQASVANNKNVIEKLQKNGIDLRIGNNTNGLMHIKALVTEKTYASGSYNWTSSATNSNDEILEIGNDEQIRNQYQKILQKLIDKNTSTGLVVATATTTKVAGILSIDQAKNYIGQYATVEGEVKKVYTAKSGVTFIDFCTNYKKCPFTAVIFASNKGQFKNIDKIKGKIRVSGLIKEYDGRAEIILEDKEQLTVGKD